MSKVLIVIDQLAAFGDVCEVILKQDGVQVVSLGHPKQVLRIEPDGDQEFLIVERWVEVDDDGHKERQELCLQPDLILCSPHPSLGDTMILDDMVDGKISFRFFLNPEEAPAFTRDHRIGREEMIFKCENLDPFLQELKQALGIV